MELPKRKQIRLQHGLYVDSTAVCSLSIATHNRRKAFIDVTLAEQCIQLLCGHAGQAGIQLYGYCLMPDHLHLLLSPSADCGIFEFVGQYKGLSTRLAWRHGVEGKLWQTRFFDRFLRGDEDVEQVVEYILANPVRGELVSDWRDYLFSGSLVYDLER